MNKKAVLIIIFFLFLVGVLFYFFLNRIQKPNLLDTSPKDGAIDVLETSQISINFEPNIQEKAKQKISVTFDPQISFDSTWLANTYKIIPKLPLSNNTKYSVKVLFIDKSIYEFSFETSLFSQADIQKFGAQQSKDDYDYGQALKILVNKYPFYTSLPIKTKDYVVYYDFELNKFAITFIDPNITPTQKDVFIKDALVGIRKIGAKDPIYYYTQP
ncbi:MAG TPA: Ig-like domain-containing protein [Patescibacteria group bacterium]|nr:Ig-like domain-containing protein [Patescibacteria group bacterium]